MTSAIQRPSSSRSVSIVNRICLAGSVRRETLATPRTSTCFRPARERGIRCSLRDFIRETGTPPPDSRSSSRPLSSILTAARDRQREDRRAARAAPRGTSTSCAARCRGALDAVPYDPKEPGIRRRVPETPCRQIRTVRLNPALRVHAVTTRALRQEEPLPHPHIDGTGERVLQLFRRHARRQHHEKQQRVQPTPRHRFDDAERTANAAPVRPASPTPSSQSGAPRGGSQRSCRQATADDLEATCAQPERSRPQRAPTSHQSDKRERSLGPSPRGPGLAGAASAATRHRPPAPAAVSAPPQQPPAAIRRSRAATRRRVGR